MNISDDRTFDVELRRLIDDTVPHEVESRLRVQLAGFQRRLSDEAPMQARRVRRTRRFRTAIVVAAVTLLTVGFLYWPRFGMSRVAAAVLAQPWVHVRTVQADNTVIENWISPTMDVWAYQSPDLVSYDDYRLRLQSSYKPAEQKLIRDVGDWKSGAGRISSLTEALKSLSRCDSLSNLPLTGFDFLGTMKDKLQVLSQQVVTTTEQDIKWIDYRITVKHIDHSDPYQVLVRVDERTKLPKSCLIKGFQDGRPVVLESQFDYPGHGPGDIYDLGVVKESEVVDRLPKADLGLILESIQAGRDRMNHYRSLFVSVTGSEENTWGRIPDISYRKGNKYRRDSAVGSTPNNGIPNADDDLKEWWMECVKKYPYYPSYIQHGPNRYNIDLTSGQNADGTSGCQIAKVTKFESRSNPFPTDYAMRAEFICRPPMGIDKNSPKSYSLIELHPPDAPDGCILLRVDAKAATGGTSPESEFRYWLDPNRGFIAMRWESVTHKANQADEVDQHIVDEIERSPEGVWYATKIRRKVRRHDGTRTIEMYYIYVDFDFELPDSLFVAPKSGSMG